MRPKKTHFSFKVYYFLKKLTMSVKASSSLSLNVETGEEEDILMIINTPNGTLTA